MTREPIRLALVMDHPAQQFAQALCLLAGDPEVRLGVHYWSVAERIYDAGFDRRSPGTSTSLGDTSGQRPRTLGS